MADSQQMGQEKIGNVTLDYTYYPGEDFYSDGKIEDEMLEIAMNNAPSRFPEIIGEKKSWPIFYHFSPLRTNIIDWLPFKKTDKVLEIGSGCGAITGALARRTGSVTCVDLSKKRSLVNAYRNQQYDNITILLGNFKDIEPSLATDYDYVLLIGVFEYGQAYIGGDTPYEDFMRICARHRKLDGRLVIAIENKFGLKYWAGCREDHLGTYFSGLEGYQGGGSARTFTRRGLEQILDKAGIGEYSFYYPYPDYKFMTMIYSDRYLPKKGELSNNLRNFDRERVLLFDEKLVFDQIIEEKEFPLFSNSYLLIAGGQPKVAYAKFSNDRSPEWAIRTVMVQDKSGQFHVEKQPDTEAACEHLLNTKRAFESLSKRYEGTKIDINQCSVIDGDIKNGLAFEYCNGQTLEALLDECLQRADMQGFQELVAEYMHWLSYRVKEAESINIDFIFPNILVDGDKWHVIDYEWTFNRQIDVKIIAYRAFYNYLLGGEGRKVCEELLMKDMLQFSDEEAAAAMKEEKAFQNMITGNHASAEHVRELIGNKAYDLEGMIPYVVTQQLLCDTRYVIQVFTDYGEGFSEENSVRLKNCYTEGRILRFGYDVPENAVRIRVDPCMYMCAVVIKEIRAGDKVYALEEIETTGCLQECGVVIFDNDDANFAVAVTGGTKLEVHMEVFELPEELACQIVKDSTKEEAKEDILSKMKSFLKHR